MEQGYNPPDGGKISFRYGLIFGLGLFVLGVIIQCLNVFVFNSPDISYVPMLLTGFAWLVVLGIFFLVGVLVGRKVGKVGSATISGIWTAIFNGVPYAIFAIIIFYTYTLNKSLEHLPTTSSTSSMGPEAMRSFLVAGGILGVVFELLFTIGFGAGMAALGGLLGRHLFQKDHPNAFAGMPYPGQAYPQPGQPLYQGQAYPQPGQPLYQGQAYPQPGQPPYPGQPYPQSGQPYPQPGQPPYPGQAYPQPGQPYRSQPSHPGYPAPGRPDETPGSQQPERERPPVSDYPIPPSE